MGSEHATSTNYKTSTMITVFSLQGRGPGLWARNIRVNAPSLAVLYLSLVLETKPGRKRSGEHHSAAAMGKARLGA